MLGDTEPKLNVELSKNFFTNLSLWRFYSSDISHFAPDSSTKTQLWSF